MAINQNVSSDVALLAPVPLDHLISGLETIKNFGKVAFGSRAFQVFRTLKGVVGTHCLDVFIYASEHAASMDPAIFWRARCIAFFEVENGEHPEGIKYRPKTTLKYPSDNSGYWALFWEVDQLRTANFNISKLRPFGRKNPYNKFFVPEGPILIEPSLE